MFLLFIFSLINTIIHLLPVSKPEHCNVCFWYIPPSLRGLPRGPDRDMRLHQVQQNLTMVPVVQSVTRFELTVMFPPPSSLYRWLRRSKAGWWRRALFLLAINLWEPMWISSGVCSPILPHNKKTSTSCWMRSLVWAMTCDLWYDPPIPLWSMSFLRV